MNARGQPTDQPSGKAAPARSGVSSQAARARETQRNAHVHAEQVRLLYAGARTALLANVVNASILAFLLWNAVDRPTLKGWLGAMVFVQLARLALAYLYRITPAESPWPILVAHLKQAARWDRWYMAGSAATGLLWGLAGFSLFPRESPELQLALIFILAGTAAGGAAVLSSVWLAFPVFAFPVLIPLGVRFFLEGTPHYTMMGALTFIYLAVLLNVARLIHDPIVSSIRLRLENADLIAALTAKASDLAQINQLLRTELGGKTEALDQLGAQVFFLQQMMDAIPNPIYYKDTNGVYEGCNKALESFLGRSRSDIVGKTVFDIVPAEFAEFHHRKDLELLRQGSTQTFETKVRAADGSLRTVLLCKALYRNPLGAVTGIIGVLLDITERKQAEEAQRERARLAGFAAEVSLALNRDVSEDDALRHCVEATERHLGAALARIWVIAPGDLCVECHKASACANRTECLHLRASAGLSVNLNGEFRRVPLGALKIGRIAQGWGAISTNDVLNDERLPNKEWLRTNGLLSFAGFPLIVEGRVYGVMAMFAKFPLSKPMLETLESVCNGVAATIARRRAERALRGSHMPGRVTSPISS